jgi:hypothetical protein
MNSLCDVGVCAKTAARAALLTSRATATATKADAATTEATTTTTTTTATTEAAAAAAEAQVVVGVVAERECAIEILARGRSPHLVVGGLPCGAALRVSNAIVVVDAGAFKGFGRDTVHARMERVSTHSVCSQQLRLRGARLHDVACHFPGFRAARIGLPTRFERFLRVGQGQSVVLRRIQTRRKRRQPKIRVQLLVARAHLVHGALVGRGFGRSFTPSGRKVGHACAPAVMLCIT